MPSAFLEGKCVNVNFDAINEVLDDRRARLKKWDVEEEAAKGVKVVLG